MLVSPSGILAAGLSLLALVPTTLAVACNGHEEYCSRSYSNVSIVGAHDSYGVSPGNIAANQNYTVKTQLDNGIRMLQVQGHMNNGVLHLCHTLCVLLDAGPFETYLSTVKTWLDANPNEVVTLLLVNTDAIAPSVWGAAYTAAGLANYTYTPSSVPVAYSAWPTLQELITDGTRLVSFLAQNADVSEVPYLLDEFTNVWETPFDETDSSFPCTVDRVTGSYVGKMYLINHFLDVNVSLLGSDIPIPASSALLTTNAATGTGSLGAQADLCLSNWGYLPTFTLVDYYDVGNGSVFQYAATLNGVTYVAEPVGNGTASASTTSATSATSSKPLSAASRDVGSLSSVSLLWATMGLLSLAAAGTLL